MYDEPLAREEDIRYFAADSGVSDVFLGRAGKSTHSHIYMRKDSADICGTV